MRRRALLTATGALAAGALAGCAIVGDTLYVAALRGRAVWPVRLAISVM